MRHGGSLNQMIDEEQARQMLCELVATPSPSGGEGKVAQLAAAWMSRSGISAHIDPVGNVVGQRGPEQGPVIVLLGHIDTVPSLIRTVADQDTLHGRGAVDAKGSFATFIAAVANHRQPRARYVIIGAVDEESAGSRGARHVRDHYRPDAVIIGEPSGCDGFTIGYKGRLAATYSVSCRPAHSAAEPDNASALAMAFWAHLGSLVARTPAEAGREGIFWQPQLHCDALHGTAESATLRFALRVPPGFPAQEFLAELIPLTGPGALRVDEMTPAVLFSRTSPAARALTRALRETGLAPRIKVKTGTCDMNVVAAAWPIDMIAYGPGDSALDHTPDEHLRWSEYGTAISVLGRALVHLETDLLSRRSDATGKEPSP